MNTFGPPMTKHKSIRAAVKRVYPWVSAIRISFRRKADGSTTSCDARDWADEEDLHDNVLLSHVRERDIPKDAILDCWCYEGRGINEELRDHVTVTLQGHLAVAATEDHYSKVRGR